MAGAPSNDPTDPVDPNEFLLVASPWAVVAISQATSGKTRIEEVAGLTKANRRIAFLFSDRDLAEEWIRRTGRTDWFPMQLGTPIEYLRWLEQLQTMGFTDATFDPGPKRMRTAPVARMIEDMRRQLPPEGKPS
jgi:hypothetical protein